MADDESRWIDTSESEPRLRLAALLSTGFAAIVLGQVRGVIYWIEGFAGGITTTADGVAAWFVSFIADLIGFYPGQLLRIAWRTNAEFITSFAGALALPIIIFEIALFVMLIGYMREWAASQIDLGLGVLK